MRVIRRSRQRNKAESCRERMEEMIEWESVTEGGTKAQKGLKRYRGLTRAKEMSS